jgi:hypothetical protein
MCPDPDSVNIRIRIRSKSQNLEIYPALKIIDIGFRNKKCGQNLDIKYLWDKNVLHLKL